MQVLSPLTEEHLLQLQHLREQGKLTHTERELQKHEVVELEREQEYAHHEVEVLLGELNR